MLTVGQKVITPSGRTAIVKKFLSGRSKQDPFERVICQYEDAKDQAGIVTLQPCMLKPVSETNKKLLSMLQNNKIVSIEQAAKNLGMSKDFIIASVLDCDLLKLCVCAELR